MRVFKLLTAALSVAAITLALVPAAQAHEVTKGDLNDSASPLDVRSTKFYHTRDLYVGGVETFDVFRNAMLGSHGDVYVDLDSLSGREADYYVHMSMVSGSLKARVYRYSGTSSYLLGKGSVWRPDNRLVMFSFRKSLIRRGTGYIRWFGSSRYESGVDAYGKILNWWDNTAWKTHNF